MTKAVFALFAALYLSACSASNILENQNSNSAEHATSTGGVGFNIRMNEANSKVLLALDIKSAGHALLLKAASLGQAEGYYADSEFETVGKDWVRARKPGCRPSNGRRLGTTEYELDVECTPDKK